MDNVPTIQVIEETIDVTLPSNSVRMLIVQPFLEFNLPPQEPFTLLPACSERLLVAIDNVLTLCASASPHFVVFPEYSLPGVDAVERLKVALLSRPLPQPLIVLGGIDGLSHAEYTRLCQIAGVPVHVDPTNAAAAIDPAKWVNTSITFIRDDAGALSLWVQPKLSPSWPEAATPHQSMFQGSRIRVFRARFGNGIACRFFSLLCFDWIGCESGTVVPKVLLQQFNGACQTTGSAQSVHWAFVLQHNRKANDHTFLTAASEFLTDALQFPFVERRDAAVVMVCTANARAPSRGGLYGYSSLIFSPTAPFDTKRCNPTFSTRSLRLRSSDALGACKDVVFREMGECIHLIEVRVPTYVTPNATDRTPPLELAEVFPLQPPQDDPRIPGAAVSAVVKWVNDELDEVPDLVGPYFEKTSLEEPMRISHRTVIDGYRRVESQRLALRIHASAAVRTLSNKREVDPASDVDEWDKTERDGLRHVMETLTLIGSVAAIEVPSAQFHARHSDSGVEIAAIRGSTHADCRKAFGALVNQTHSPVVLVCQDDRNAVHLPREMESFADPRKGCGMRITDSQTLLTTARGSTPGQYQDVLMELFSVADRRIV